MTTLSLLSELTEQRNAIREFLRENAPETFNEQAHLDEEADARAYWSHGYQAALADVIRLIACQEDHNSDRSTHLPEDGPDADDCRAVERRGTGRILA